MQRWNDSIYEALVCPVCLQLFVDPKQLTCGHSVCCQCLESMVSFLDTPRITCPLCRMDTSDIPSNLSKNYALENLVKCVVAESTTCSNCSRAALQCAFTCWTCNPDNPNPNLLCLRCAFEHHYNTRHAIESFEPRSDDIHETCVDEVEKIFEKNTKPLTQGVRNLQQSVSKLSTSLQKHMDDFRLKCDIVVASKAHRALFLKQYNSCMKHGKIIELLGTRTRSVLSFVKNLLEDMTETLEKYLPKDKDDPDVMMEVLCEQFVFDASMIQVDSSVSPFNFSHAGGQLGIGRH